MNYIIVLAILLITLSLSTCISPVEMMSNPTNSADVSADPINPIADTSATGVDNFLALAQMLQTNVTTLSNQVSQNTAAIAKLQTFVNQFGSAST